jgi:hypothetical protein
MMVLLLLLLQATDVLRLLLLPLHAVVDILDLHSSLQEQRAQMLLPSSCAGVC